MRVWERIAYAYQNYIKNHSVNNLEIKKKVYRIAFDISNGNTDLSKIPRLKDVDVQELLRYFQNNMDEIIKMFNLATRMVNVTLYSILCTKYSKELNNEEAKVLAAQVVNFLNGEEKINEIDLQDSTKISFLMIKNQIWQKAFEAMRSDPFTKEVIVNTLMMRISIQLTNVEHYLESPEYGRIDGVLKEFGPEFPKAVVPDEYWKLVLKYHQERFKQ